MHWLAFSQPDTAEPRCIVKPECQENRHKVNHLPESLRRAARLFQAEALSAFAIVATLSLIETLCFAAAYARTGFYLDDWLMLAQLTFGPKDYLHLISSYFVQDPRVVIRPIEALHFGTVFFFPGANPVGWRLSNMFMEVASAFLTFLIVGRLSRSRVLGFLAAAFLLTYPIHDATHYWAVCSCVSLSLVFYLLSLWCTICSADATRDKIATGAKRSWLLPAAALFYALSIFGYEPFLPLCALNVVSYIVLTCLPLRTANNVKQCLQATAKLALPYTAIVASLLVYQRFIAPQLTKVSLHTVDLNSTQIVGTVYEGIRISSPLCSVPFIWDQATQMMHSEFSFRTVVQLFAVAALMLAGILIAHLSDGKSEPNGNFIDSRRGVNPAGLIALGFFVVIMSYTIFGLNPEYKPILTTIVNRINTGAALGWSIIFAGLIGWLSNDKSLLPMRRSISLLTSCSSAVVIVIFAMANIELSRPWQLSWAVQQHTFEELKKKKDVLADASSVLLINCPRYVNCSPVFDGAWDFQEMLSIATGRTDIKGGVVSERMQVDGASVKDITMSYVCAEYPFKNLVVVTPGLGMVKKISNAREFIEVVEKNGTFFGLDKRSIAGWKKNNNL